MTLVVMTALSVTRERERGTMETLLSAMLLLFSAANLAVGFTFSTLAQNQLQAVEMSFFFFLPSMLLSGFMFPFRGMPDWAQVVGEIFPLTHFLRITRGIMLKGSGWAEIWPEVWPIALFLALAAGVALKRYRLTLDWGGTMLSHRRPRMHD